MNDRLKPKATAGGSKVLAALMELSPLEQHWVHLQFWQSLSKEEAFQLRELVDGNHAQASESEENLFGLAKERLLEDPHLNAGEKVLLAALILAELYEVQDFHSRQITETLREAANPVNNITAALSGLIAKGEAEIADPERAARNSHKRYRLTSHGLLSASSIARKKRQTQADRSMDG